MSTDFYLVSLLVKFRSLQQKHFKQLSTAGSALPNTVVCYCTVGGNMAQMYSCTDNQIKISAILNSQVGGYQVDCTDFGRKF